MICILITIGSMLQKVCVQSHWACREVVIVCCLPICSHQPLLLWRAVARNRTLEWKRGSGRDTVTIYLFIYSSYGQDIKYPRVGVNVCRNTRTNAACCR